MDKIFSDIARYCKLKGITSFVLSTKKGNAIKFHYENMNYGDLIQLSLAGLRQVIDMYLSSKKWSAEYKQIYLDFLRDMNVLVKKTDARVIEFNKRNKQEK